jgi:PAS domain-containing protein
MENELGRLDALPGCIWTALPDGHFDFVNRGWREYAGLGVQEASGWGWRRAIHPEDLPELLERWRAMLASGEAGDLEARVRPTMASTVGSSSPAVRCATKWGRSSNGMG